MPFKEKPRDIEVKIQSNKDKFDFISLLRLLNYLGYTDNQVRFKSYNSLVSQSGLIRKLQFDVQAEKKVVITLNLGLLGPQTPLPGYFQKMVDDGTMDVGQFFQFINFFDHPLIENFILGAMPERNTKLFSDWEKTKLNLIKTLDLKSVSTLHWFLSLYFPELSLRVDKVRQKRKIRTKPFILGHAILGDTSTFGSTTTIFTHGLKITFFVEDQSIHQGIPWPKEIKKRLKEWVFPVLSTVDMDLQVILVIKYQRSWAKLQSDSYLGYDKIRGGKNPLRVIRIYNGYLSG